MAGGVQGMELAGNLLILGSIAVAGGAALAWGDKLRRRFFVKSSDEYFEYRKKLLVNGIAVRSDVDATRERAVDAYARLLTFDEAGHEGRVQEEHIVRSREFLEQYQFGALLEKIELTASDIYDNRSEERFMARKEGRNPDDAGSGKIRDIVREVILDTMPAAEVVDPFDSMLRPSPDPAGNMMRTICGCDPGSGVVRPFFTITEFELKVPCAKV